MPAIIRILSILLLAFILTSVVGSTLSAGLLKYNTQHKRLSEIYENNSAHDMVFVGSSRAMRAIYPKIIDSICGVDSYNAGMDAATMVDIKMVVEGYLVNHPAPKFLVITIDLNSLCGYNGISYYSRFFPYVHNPVLYSTRSSWEYAPIFYKIFPFLSFTSFGDDSRQNACVMFLKKEIPNSEKEYKGYIFNGDGYIRAPSKAPSPEMVTRRMTIDTTAVGWLNETLSLCKKKDIKVIFVYAPEYNFNLQKTWVNVDSVFGNINQIASKNNIPFLREDSLPLSKDPKLFANNGHLNNSGANVYSTILASQINRLIKIK